MKNKAFRILLILILILPVGTSLLYLSYQKKLVRKSVKKMIIREMDKSELKLLIFPITQAENLHWKHDKEFEYQGKMYDVVQSEEKNGFIYYWCWLDNDETALNKKIDRILSNFLGNNPDKKEKKKQVRDFYKSLFIEDNSLAIFYSNGLFEQLISTYYNAKINDVFLDLPLPPPKFFM